jgi:hypothetical protein
MTVEQRLELAIALVGAGQKSAMRDSPEGIAVNCGQLSPDSLDQIYSLMKFMREKTLGTQNGSRVAI